MRDVKDLRLRRLYKKLENQELKDEILSIDAELREPKLIGKICQSAGFVLLGIGSMVPSACAIHSNMITDKQAILMAGILALVGYGVGSSYYLDYLELYSDRKELISDCKKELKKENKKVKYVDSLVNEKEEDYMPVVKLKSWK